MLVELFKEDLRLEFKDVPTSATRFEHFGDRAQQAIFAANGAVYKDKWSHNAIYPPSAYICDVCGSIAEDEY